MHDLLHRLAVALLAGCGLATLAAAWMAAAPAPLPVQHHQVLIALTGAGLLAAAARPAWRMPALGAALASKLSLLLLALPAPPAGEGVQAVALLGAGAILAHEARREARWNLGRRQEG